MATFNPSITIPDSELSTILNALKKINPIESGETNTQYIKRYFKEYLTNIHKSE